MSTIWSGRDNIQIFLPLSEWMTTDSVKRKISKGGLISVGRFADAVDNAGDEIYGFLRTHDIEKP
ncbi:MAG: hypothetical protein ABEK59_01405 [Halobacteria archaeon]